MQGSQADPPQALQAFRAWWRQEEEGTDDSVLDPFPFYWPIQNIFWLASMKGYIHFNPAHISFDFRQQVLSYLGRD